MDKDELLKRKTAINVILIFIIVILVLTGIISYKKYFDEKREREIGDIIGNTMSDIKTPLERTEEKLSIMDKMSFSANGSVLFISISYFEDEDLKLEELTNAIYKAKEEYWFIYDYVVTDIWNPKFGMVTSIEMNLDTMETRNCDWYGDE